jgi:hypothetical protein
LFYFKLKLLVQILIFLAILPFFIPTAFTFTMSLCVACHTVTGIILVAVVAVRFSSTPNNPVHPCKSQLPGQSSYRFSNDQRSGTYSVAMTLGGASIATGEPVRNEKIPRSQQRSEVVEHISRQLQDAAEQGAAGPIISISNFLNHISGGPKNPKTNMNAMRLLIEKRCAPAAAVGNQEDAVLLRSSDVRFC